MAERDILVEDGPAASCDALQLMLPVRPGDLAAAALVVTHLPDRVGSRLRHLLREDGALPIRTAEDGKPIGRGKILFAPRGLILMPIDGVVRVGLGARKPMMRRAIDRLFRFAALSFGGGRDTVGRPGGRRPPPRRNIAAMPKRSGGRSRCAGRAMPTG
ncbi:MAG: hypothetical protein EOP58_14415, partial [Sphingomonadales bacterium]